MRKGLSILLAVALLGVFAVPAMAEFNFSGFIRDKFFTSNYERYDAGDLIPFKNGNVGTDEKVNPSGGSALPAIAKPPRYMRINTDAHTASYFEQRARLKFEAKTDTVGAVAFFEYDFRFGDAAYKVGRNSGGGLEADTINQETKNLYLWFKPTAGSVINVGLQNLTDAYRGVILGYADIAGVFGAVKLDPVDIRFGYGVIKHAATVADNTFNAITTAGQTNAGSHLVTNNTLVTEDSSRSVDLYLLEGHVSPVKDARVGVNYYFINDQQALNKLKGHIIGADGSFKVIDPLTLSAFAFFQAGKVEKGAPNLTDDLSLKGYAGDIRADVTAGPGKGFFEVIYISGDDDPTDSDYKGIINGNNYALTGAFYTSTDMEILLPNIDDTNTAMALTLDPKNFGQGLIHLGAGYTMPIPGMDKLSFKVGAGHSRFASASDKSAFKKKTQGTELNARVNYNMAKGLDLGLIAAYCWLGDAYKTSATNTSNNVFAPSTVEDPANLYKIIARVNYAF